MKKAKRNAVLVIIAFILLLGLAVFTGFFGIGDRGLIKYINLGLDLKGGLSVTYEIQDEKYSDADVDDTKFKLEKRIDAYSNEYSVYQEGNGNITCEIPGVTNAEEILEKLSVEGKLEFLDPDNYTLWSQGKDYELSLIHI